MNEPNFQEWRGLSRGFCTVSEAEILWAVCAKKKPKQILEIGRRDGLSTTLFGLIAKETGGRVFSVDGAPRLAAEKRLQEFGVDKYVTLINEWSPWVPFDFSWSLDLLYIDGDHKYISTLVDYHTFNYFLKTGGLVAFHDSLYRPVAEAIKQAIKRDRLIKVAEENQLVVFRKQDKARRVYFQFRKGEFSVK